MNTACALRFASGNMCIVSTRLFFDHQCLFASKIKPANLGRTQASQRHKNMRSNTSSRKLPANPTQWEKVIAKALGKDHPATVKERTGRSNSVVATAGGYAALREAPAAKRQG